MAVYKFKVALWEYERDWGSKIDEIKDFDVYQEAVDYIEDFNKGNTEETAPDWYMVARPHNFDIQN